MITQVKDTDEGLQLLSAVHDLLNQCWDKRDTIQTVKAMRRARWMCGRCSRKATANAAARRRAWRLRLGCCSKNGGLKNVPSLPAIPRLQSAAHS